jgi:hypothetical protein
MFSKILHLIGHLLEFGMVGFDFFFLLLNFFFGHCQAFFGFEFDEFIEFHVSEFLFRLGKSFLYGLLVFREEANIFGDESWLRKGLGSEGLGGVLDNESEGLLDH